MNEWSEANRRMWDERVPIHVASDFYDVEGFLAGRSTLLDFEREELPGVAGRSLVHLQCHFGQDTLSWAREGAAVWGLDFSGPAIEAARGLAARAGIDATFVQADVHDAPAALGRRFDVVYTGRGALNWLPDVERWARTVAALLEPGGTLLLSEFHPFTDVFADEDLGVRYGYFHDEPMTWDELPGSYADRTARTQHNRSYEWVHGLGAVVTAVIGAGLRVVSLREHETTEFARWPCLERDAGGRYRLPAGTPRLPLMYSLRAVREP